MKILISDIYKDNNTIITDNTYINDDERMSSLTDLSADLDLILETNYGARELLKKYLVEDDTEVYKYDLSKVHKAVYACYVLNHKKYELMLKTDTQVDSVNPLEQFKTETTYGEKVSRDNIAGRVDTTIHGDVDTTTNIGQSTETSNLGARDVTNSVTSFSSSTFNDTDKSVQSLTQDSTIYGNRQDTEKIERGNDTITRGAHNDTHTDEEHTTTVVGYRDETEGLVELREYSRQNTLKEILNDVINTISYGMYLF